MITQDVLLTAEQVSMLQAMAQPPMTRTTEGLRSLAEMLVALAKDAEAASDQLDVVCDAMREEGEEICEEYDGRE